MFALVMAVFPIMDLNDPELEFSDLIYAYQSWVIAIINDAKLNEKDEKFLTDEIADDALDAIRFLSGDVTNAIESSLARVYEIEENELNQLLFPEEV